MPAKPPTIWADVEDIFAYAQANPRPSGIQRLAFELLNAMRSVLGDAGGLELVRHDEAGLMRPIPWESLEALFAGLTTERAEAPPSGLAAPRRDPLRSLASSFVHTWPASVRDPMRQAWTLQRAVLNVLASVRGSWRDAPRPEQTPALPSPVAVGEFARRVRPGDVMLVPGAAWVHEAFSLRLAALKAQHGVHVMLLAYDLIPLRRPEWCVRHLVEQFGAWASSTLPLCDTILAISAATARDVELFARERGICLPGPVRVVPVGTGFGSAAGNTGSDPATHAPPPGLPRPGSYALFVSTVEVRKNHILLFRLWRRLLDERGSAAVPDLVFAGRPGWLVADLLQQLENTGWLGGKVRLVRNPTDTELRALYDGCLFTLFPSLYEGWGLPVTESLAVGKPCLCSGTTSLPEAGGALARYFDPESLSSVHEAVVAVLDDPAGLAEWEGRVRREFMPVAWTETARAVLAALPACAA